MNIVLLDRDGVINEDSDEYIKSAQEWHALAGSIEAIAALHRAGFSVVVVTNQSGLARQLFSRTDLDAMHNKLRQQLAIAGAELTAIYFCPHHPRDNCLCRKPATGMLDQLESDFGIRLDGQFLVGDSLKDLQLARAKGCRPVLVKTGKGKQTAAEIANKQEWQDVPIFADLAAASQYIIDSSNH